jgi:hypothetical protein
VKISAINRKEKTQNFSVSQVKPNVTAQATKNAAVSNSTAG